MKDILEKINLFLPTNESQKSDKYQEFFKKKLKEYKVDSPAKLSAADKKKFFAEIKKEWKG
jgi:hypothetical protein